MDPLPLFVVAPPSSIRNRVLSQVSGAVPQLLESVEPLLSRDGEEWGILLLSPDLPAEEVLRILRSQGHRRLPWVTLLVEEEGDELVARPLSLGPPEPIPVLMDKALAPEERGPVLDLNWVLRFVAKARHDLNNPLTSGLAEVQLLLMDEHPPEVRESLETIQEQFRRLRDMVADLGRLRVAPRTGLS